jgi:hypothetical protein
MSFRYSADLDGEPAGWSDEGFKNEKAALQRGRAVFDGPVWIAWVTTQDYSAMFPTPGALLADLKERAAELGADVSCFDALTDADKDVLAQLVTRTVKNWEQWLPLEKRSTLVIVEKPRLYQPTGV